MMCEHGIIKVAKTKPDSETKIEKTMEVFHCFLIHNIIPMKIYTGIKNQNILTDVPIYLQQCYSNIFTTSITQYLPDSHLYIQVLFEPLHRLI